MSKDKLCVCGFGIAEHAMGDTICKEFKPTNPTGHHQIEHDPEYLKKCLDEHADKVIAMFNKPNPTESGNEAVLREEISSLKEKNTRLVEALEKISKTEVVEDDRLTIARLICALHVATEALERNKEKA